MTHEQWTRLGDIAEAVKEWAITAIGVLVAALVGSSLGTFFFLAGLSKLGQFL